MPHPADDNDRDDGRKTFEGQATFEAAAGEAGWRLDRVLAAHSAK